MLSVFMRLCISVSQLGKGFPWIFLDPRANYEFVTKFYFALHVSHAALPVSVKMSL
jgi:hypothetical protein